MTEGLIIMNGFIKVYNSTFIHYVHIDHSVHLAMDTSIHLLQQLLPYYQALFFFLIFSFALVFIEILQAAAFWEYKTSYSFLSCQQLQY